MSPYGQRLNSPPELGGAQIEVETRDFSSLEGEWQELLQQAALNHIFFSPHWVRLWWQYLDQGELTLLAFKQGSRTLAVAPLLCSHGAVTLAADKEVCDYADFIVGRGAEAETARALLAYLSGLGQRLDFQPLLPDSPIVTHLAPLAQSAGFSVTIETIKTTVRLSLPHSWESYLDQLTGKERHEVRRKLRHLYSADGVRFYSLPPTPATAEEFLSLFRASRSEKAEFLTAEREAFFRGLMAELGERGYAKLYFLEVGGKRVAALLCFDYGDTLYLYNSGFDPGYAYLSAGLMSKVLCIRDAIERGKKVFDFLSGGESYKLRLGGAEVPLYRCVITLPQGTEGMVGESHQ